MRDRQVEGLSTLLSLQHELRKLNNVRDFGFFVVNETFRLIKYKHAFLWNKKPAVGHVIEGISGVANIDKHTPFNQWVLKLIGYCDFQNDTRDIHIVQRKDLPENITFDWPEGVGEYVLWCPFVQAGHDYTAGLLLLADQEWTEGDVKRASWLLQSYAYTWYYLTESHGFVSWLKRLFKYKKYWLMAIVLFFIIILVVPVKQSVIAPAEVIAMNPTIITAPIQGVIKNIEVSPNEVVKENQILFNMDQTDLKSQLNLALQEYSVAQEKYQRAVQKGFKEPESRAEVNILKAGVQERRAAALYAQALLKKSVVRAPKSGTVIFSSTSDWQGKPVEAGEKIMELARPNKVELEIWLPVSDAIQFDTGADVKLYLKSAPTQPLTAKLRYASYHAELTPSNILSYRMIATFNAKQKLPRIGLQGSAKIYGERSVLIYWILRKPLAGIRQTVGW